jgi:purine catabolism regulator
MLSVQSLLTDVGLELSAGKEAAATPIRWVHVSELADPTPWLSGGELLLTTGMALSGDEQLREYVQRLSDHKLAGLGFGTGFGHDALPEALVKEAGARGLPLFEVPYDVPFIAITESAFDRLVNDQYDILRRGMALHAQLERLVIEQRGLSELVRTLSTAIGGSVLVLDGRGGILASHAFRVATSAAAIERLAVEIGRHSMQEPAAAFIPEEAELAGRAVALPVPVRPSSTGPTWLVAIRDGSAPADYERLVIRQAATVVALELMREQTIRETERRLAGDVIAEALAGELGAEQLAERLRRFGIGERFAVLAAATVGDPAEAGAELETALRTCTAATPVSTVSAGQRTLLCAVFDPGDEQPIEVALRVRAAFPAAERMRLGVRFGVSSVGSPRDLRRCWNEARCALEASALSNGDAPDVASPTDLGVFSLLLSLQDRDALRLYCEDVLGPIDRHRGSVELLRSLEAFIENNGHWEAAARALFCHRQTLRYRIGRIETLTGRDLKAARDRIEFWLALRGRELLP